MHEDCYHFTNIKNLNSINRTGLNKRLEIRSDCVKDKKEKISYSIGKIGVIGLYANFQQVYDEVKAGIRKADPNDLKQVKSYEEIKKSPSIEAFLGDGAYLLFDGEGVENTGGNTGEGGIYDASTLDTIEPNKLRVGLVRDNDSGHVSYSMYDYIHYLMSTLTLEEYEQMIKPMQERFDNYYHSHKDEIDKFKKGNFTKKELPLSKFVEVEKAKLEKAEREAKDKDAEER